MLTLVLCKKHSLLQEVFVFANEQLAKDSIQLSCHKLTDMTVSNAYPETIYRSEEKAMEIVMRVVESTNILTEVTHL